jgi:hypothetical protein
MSPPSPPLGALRRQLGRSCAGGPPLWQNTIEYNWLGPGESLDRRLVLEVVPIGRRLWPKRLRARRLQKKRGAVAISGNRCPKVTRGIAQR